MTTPSDTQSLILSRAATRPGNLALPLPEGLVGAAAKMVVGKMIARGWLEEVDANLRPEGRQGPLVRTLASYAAYYEQWAQPWEIQALLRAHRVAGDADLGHRFLLMADETRYPAGGVSATAVQEIRRVKARVDAERLPRGADPNTHTKLGRGGLADVEWTVQLLQLRHAHQVPALHNTSTLQALDAIGEAELIDRDDVELLREAWLTATRARNALLLVRGRRAELKAGHRRGPRTGRP